MVEEKLMEPNKCPKCKSYVERPVILRTPCYGPHSCLQNEPGYHVHIDTICPFCGYVFQTFVERKVKSHE
jgi:hypothetical protein